MSGTADGKAVHRVLVLAAFLENLGGCENTTSSLALGLTEQGHEVAIAVAGPVHPRWQRRLEGLTVHSLSPGSPLEDLRHVLDTWQPDLVHAIPYERTAFELVTTDAPRPPVVGSELSAGSLSCGWWYSGEVLRAALPRFDAVHCLAEASLANLRRDYRWSGPGYVVPSPFPSVPGPFWSRTEPARRLLSMGRLSVEKGQAWLVAAMPVLRRAVPGLQVDFWGYGPMEDDLKRLATTVGLARSIRFRGHFDSAREVPMEAYDALILTSWIEGIPKVVLEALDRGLPVVATKVGGLADILGKAVEGVYLVEPGSQAELADALVNLLGRYERLSSSARERREISARHAPDRVLPGYQRMYSDILATSSLVQDAGVGETDSFS